MSYAVIDSDVALDCEIVRIETDIRQYLNGRVFAFRMLIRGHGLVLQGRASTYHAKQLAQHAVMRATRRRILANEIEVNFDDADSL